MRIVSGLIALLIAGGGGWYYMTASQNGGSVIPAAMRGFGLEAPGETSAAKPAAFETGEGQGEVRRIVVGLDLSRSNPLITEPEYASKAADRVASLIAPLGFRSEIMVRTLGVYGGGDNTFRFDAVVSSRYRPETMADEVKLLIASTPALVQRGTWSAQSQTNILGWLENMAQVVDCGAMPTTYVLLTDGLEDSEYVRLKNKDAKLPAPSAALFKGCDQLIMLGIGRGTESPETTKRLRDEWQAWAAAAGFTAYSGLNEW